MKTLVMHRALFSVLLCALCFGLAGCPNLGMGTRIQTVTDQGQLTLKEPPTDFLNKTIKVASTLGYQMRNKNSNKNSIEFLKTPDLEGVAKAVMYGGQDKTLVRLTLAPNGTIEIFAEQSGNFGQTDASLAEQVVRQFKTALEKEFQTATATARQ